MKDKQRLAHKLESNAQKVKADLVERVADYKKKIEMLEGIKRTHKKDGSEFQHLLKNFEAPEGVRIYRGEIGLHKGVIVSDYPHEITLEVEETDKEKVEEMKQKDAGRGWYLAPYYWTEWYYKNADEMEEEIKKEIEKHKERLRRAENDLEKFEGEFSELQKIADSFGDFLENLQSDNDYILTRILKEAL